MSMSPSGSFGPDSKKSDVRSAAMYARMSSTGPFTDGPSFTGVPQGSSTDSRVDTYTSLSLGVDASTSRDRNSSSPSNRTEGRESFAGELSSSTSSAGPHEPSG